MLTDPPSPKPRRLSPTQLVLAGLVLVSTAFAVDPVWEVTTAASVDYARLTHPAAYLVFAPLFGVWDTLSLLTLSQHYAVLTTLAALYVHSRTRAPKGEGPLHLRGLKEIGRALASLVALLLFYLAGVLLPRPMVGLEVSDPALVTIDFHSHTRYSHDGWSMFSPEDNRAWHEGGGFDVAYITDHYTWRGYDEASAYNPERAGDGLVTLEGAEIRIHRRPTNVFGSRDRYLFALDEDSVAMEPDSLRAAGARGERPPTMLYTMPGHLQFVVPLTPDEAAGMVAIEINDGSPRGLEQVKSQRTEIIALADSAELALVGASNLHGWGRTVASWSLMEIPGWRGMSPDDLGVAIEDRLHRERRDAVTVVERRIPYHHGSSVLVAMTFPWIAWEHFRMLSLAERVSWLLWIGAFALLARVRRGPAGHAEA